MLAIMSVSRESAPRKGGSTFKNTSEVRHPSSDVPPFPALLVLAEAAMAAVTLNGRCRADGLLVEISVFAIVT